MNLMSYLNWTSLNCPFYEASFSFDSFDRSQSLKNSKNGVCDDISSRRYLTNWKYHCRLDVRRTIEILILRRDADLCLVDPEDLADLEDLEARGDLQEQEQESFQIARGFVVSTNFLIQKRVASRSLSSFADHLRRHLQLSLCR